MAAAKAAAAAAALTHCAVTTHMPLHTHTGHPCVMAAAKAAAAATAFTHSAITMHMPLPYAHRAPVRRGCSRSCCCCCCINTHCNYPAYALAIRTQGTRASWLPPKLLLPPDPSRHAREPWAPDQAAGGCLAVLGGEGVRAGGGRGVSHGQGPPLAPNAPEGPLQVREGGGARVECVMIRVGQNRTRPSSGSKRSRRSSPGKGGRGCKSGVRHV